MCKSFVTHTQRVRVCACVCVPWSCALSLWCAFIPFLPLTNKPLTSHLSLSLSLSLSLLACSAINVSSERLLKHESDSVHNIHTHRHTHPRKREVVEGVREEDER